MQIFPIIPMTQVFAYLRVSTDAQDTANQRHSFVRYCTYRGLLAPVFVVADHKDSQPMHLLNQDRAKA
jgi:DNA invertase Pin-like site-specific DNA recombinase